MQQSSLCLVILESSYLFQRVAGSRKAGLPPSASIVQSLIYSLNKRLAIKDLLLPAHFLFPTVKANFK